MLSTSSIASSNQLDVITKSSFYTTVTPSLIKGKILEIIKVFRINHEEGYPYFINHKLLAKILDNIEDNCPIPLELFVSLGDYPYDLVVVKKGLDEKLILVEARNDTKFVSYE